ncbi:hypothetical protein D9611_003027 [Ephemerocybe angulata]|uniref:Uncharacterized protein n=1 Tax=Ephemerocybe angulata TaxID=980116 RepID=A0A8H5C929_9AGAR|nr:hypothetical protein D9611_003027 [Tulosesus angulatus]
MRRRRESPTRLTITTATATMGTGLTAMTKTLENSATLALAARRKEGQTGGRVSKCDDAKKAIPSHHPVLHANDIATQKCWQCRMRTFNAYRDLQASTIRSAIEQARFVDAGIAASRRPER